jgi:hypothetical protein
MTCTDTTAHICSLIRDRFYCELTFDNKNAAPTLSGSAINTIKVSFQFVMNARIKLLITKIIADITAAQVQPMPDCTIAMLL